MNSNFNPKLQPYFEMLPIEAKNYILESNASINTVEDLLQCVDKAINSTANQLDKKFPLIIFIIFANPNLEMKSLKDKSFKPEFCTFRTIVRNCYASAQNIKKGWP